LRRWIGRSAAVRRIWPGVGTFTQHILDRLAPDATLLTIDTNSDFTDYLNGKFTDSRLQL
jgi:phospholipid N-methyltransferase